jgi:hypothetical protein
MGHEGRCLRRDPAGRGSRGGRRRLGGPGDVVVRVTSSTICGTDLHMFDGRTGAEPGLVIGHEPPETLADSLAGSGPGRAAAERRTGGWGGPVRIGDEHDLHQRLARAVETINPASGPDRRHRPAGQDDPGAAAGSRRGGRGRGGGGRRDLGSVSAPAGLADSRRRVGPLHRHGAATRSGLPRRADRVGDHQRQVLATGHGQTGHRRAQAGQLPATRRYTSPVLPS